MSTGDGIPVVEGTNINNPSGWPIYRAADGDVLTRRAETTTEDLGRNRGIEWTLGHTGGDMYYMPTFNWVNGEISSTPPTGLSAHWEGIIPVDHTQADRMIEASGDAVDAIAGGMDIGDVDDITNASGIRAQGIQTSPQRADEEYSDGSRNFWAPEEGVLATSTPTPVLEIDEESGNLTQSALVVHTARQTNLPMTTPDGEGTITGPEGTETGVMTFAQWHEANMPTGHFWVMDAATGWFYYATPLQRGEATSMLMSEIEIKDRNDEGIEYVIEVDAQFAIRSAIPLEMPDITEDVALLWGEIGYEVTIARQEGSLEIERETPTSAGEVTVERLSIFGQGSTSTQITTPSVIWTIEGSTSMSPTPFTLETLTGITIDENTGEVTVTNEAVGGVGVAYAVATVATQSGEIVTGRRRIDVLQFIPAITDLDAHDTFTVPGSDTEWRVLLPNDGNGNALIIAEYVQQYPLSAGRTFQYNFHMQGSNIFSLFEESDAKVSVNTWFNNVHEDSVSEQIRSAALNYEFQDNEGVTMARDVQGAGIEMDWDLALTWDQNQTENSVGVSNADVLSNWHCQGTSWPHAGCQFRRALTRPIGNPGNGQAFLLSATEVNTYFIGATGETGRRTQGYENTLTIWANRIWPLRSTGHSMTNQIRVVDTLGDFPGGGTTYWVNVGMRPAVWVRR